MEPYINLDERSFADTGFDDPINLVSVYLLAFDRENNKSPFIEGTGVFIQANLVLTAKHVFDSVIKKI